MTATLKLALGLALALPLAMTAQAQQACQAIVEGIRSDTSGLIASPPRNLDQQQMIDAARGEFAASSELVQALTALTEFSRYAVLFRFGQSNLHGALTAAGSASCQSFVFFATAPDGRSALIEPPPILIGDPPCNGYGSRAIIGTAGGSPALIVDNSVDQNETITVTPWHDGAWQPACVVAVHYSATFTVTHRFCKDVDCAKVGDLARTLAMQFDKDPNSLPPAPVADPELSGQTPLPTFGQAPAPFMASVPHSFAEESGAISVTFEGQAYVARLGHSAIGWRRYPDYLFALYRPLGDRLEPVAGIFIAKKRAKPIEVTIK